MLRKEKGAIMEKFFLIFLMVFSLAKIISAVVISKTMKAPEARTQKDSEVLADKQEDI